MSKEKRYGLVLSLGGAPETAHKVPALDEVQSGLGGAEFFPHRAVLLDEIGVDLTVARKLHREAGMPVCLVAVADDGSWKAEPNEGPGNGLEDMVEAQVAAAPDPDVPVEGSDG